MAEHATRSDRLRVDDGQQVVDALDSLYRPGDLDGAVVNDIARHDAPERRPPAMRFHRQPLDANAPTLQRSGDANGERRFLGLPG